MTFSILFFSPSSISLSVDYRLDNRQDAVQFPAKELDSFFLPKVQTEYGAHPASYSTGKEGFNPG
jgi:hypothetical protein